MLHSAHESLYAPLELEKYYPGFKFFISSTLKKGSIPAVAEWIHLIEGRDFIMKGMWEAKKGIVVNILISFVGSSLISFSISSTDIR